MIKLLASVCLSLLSSSAIAVVFLQSSGGGGAFTPESPTSATLVGWFDADDSSTLWTTSARTTNVSSNLDPVGAWDDKSASSPSLSVIQATTGARPEYQTSVQNSKPGVSFVAASGEWLEASGFTLSLDEVSVFMAYEHTAQEESGRLFVFHNTADSNDYSTEDGFIIQNTEPWEGNLIRQFHYSPAPLTVDSSARTNGTVYLLQTDYDFLGQSTEMFFDGTSQGTDTTGGVGTSADPNDMLFGGGIEGHFPGTAGLHSTIKILEVLIYDSVVSAADKASIESYFDTRWAIPGL